MRAQLPVEAPPLDPIVIDRLTSVYAYESSTERAGKISVSEIKRRFVELEELAKQMIEPDYKRDISSHDDVETIESIMPNAMEHRTTGSTNDTEDSLLGTSAVGGENLQVEDTSVDLGPFDVTLASIRESTPICSGARWGTLMHEVMQWLPLQSYTRPSLRQALDSLALQGYLTDEERKAISEKRICDFFQSDLGQRLLTAQRVERELPFSMLFPANRVYPEMLDGEDLFLQGIIDTAFLEEGSWVLVDYKTDHLDEKALVERYRIQLMLYKEALERLTPYPVKEVYIYSFRLERAIPV